MEFRETQPIYLQIADYVCEKILLQQWKPDERIPSVRELAILLEVNPNTVMRTYEFLQQKEIIFNQRGIGFFVGPQAVDHATQYRLETFMDRDLPQIFRSMWLLGMNPEDLNKPFEKYKKQNFHR